MSKNVLLLSSDSHLMKFIDLTLKYNGFSLCFAKTSLDAWTFLKKSHFDLIMTDYQLKDESGLAFYKSLRQLGSTIPILIMGDSFHDEFILKDLSFQKYDYIIKPFKFRELKLKLNTLIHVPSELGNYLHIGDLEIDLARQVVTMKERILKLRKTEIKILLLLARKAGEIVDSRKIRKLLEAEGNLHNMPILHYVGSLREKLKDFTGEHMEIKLIENKGYRLDFRF